MKSYQGISWNNDGITDDIWIHSMKIPGGVKIKTYSEIDFGGTAYGRYNGPDTINEVDCRSSCYIRSLKIVKIY